jgi:hypothetical protein
MQAYRPKAAHVGAASRKPRCCGGHEEFQFETCIFMTLTNTVMLTYCIISYTVDIVIFSQYSLKLDF